MAAEILDYSMAPSKEATVLENGKKITFRYNGERLVPVAKEGNLTNPEYAEALKLAADKLGIKIRLHRRAA